MDDPTRSSRDVTIALRELPAAQQRLSTGKIEIGSDAHLAIVAILDALVVLVHSGTLTKKEEVAISGVLCGMTASQSRYSFGGKSESSVLKLRASSIAKLRKILDGKE